MAQDTPYFRRETSGIDEDGRLTCTYMGVAEGLTYIAPYVETALLPPGEQHSSVTIRETDLVRSWRDTRSDLAVLVAHDTDLGSLQLASDLHAVARIHQVVPTGDGWDSVRRRMSRREVRRGEKARQDGFHYDVSNRDDDFRFFYNRMHRPTMARRYGMHARSVPEDEAFRDLFRKGVLFRILYRGTWVAGSVSQVAPADRRLNARLIGVRDGDESYTRLGAQNFVYHSILDWATQQGSISEVDFQGCEPFLSKGTFQYKKRFGATARLPDNIFGSLRMVIRADLRRMSVRDFLVSNPYITMSDDKDLCAVYCFDSVRPPRLDLPYASPGIAGHRVLDLDALADSQAVAPQHASD